MGAGATENRQRPRATRTAGFAVLLVVPALLAPGLSSAASATLPGPGGTVDVEAPELTYDAETERFTLSGGARLRRGALLLRARSVRYDPKTGEVDAAGDVWLTGPGRLLVADGLHAFVDGPWEAHRVSTFVKSRPLNLDRVGTAAEAIREGRNRVSLWAKEVHGASPPWDANAPFTAESVRLTLCDCGSGAPSWEIHASKADVTPGTSAVLTWPVIYVTPRFLFIDKPIPILPLPWLYVPLASRQSGFLFPYFNIGSRNGFELGEPYFLTLGESWDATFTAGYSFGPSSSAIQGALNAVPQQNAGVRGAEGSAELRWAPVQDVNGETKLYFMHDTIPYVWKPASGNRIGLTLRNGAQFSGTFVNAEAGLVGDAAYPQDFVGDLLLRNAPYLRSSLAAGHAFSDVVVEADVTYNEEIGTLGQPGVPVVSFGVFGGSVPSFHRLPAVSASLLPVPLAGPVLLLGQAGLARFAPLSGLTDQSVRGIGPGERFWPFVPLPTPPFPAPPPAGESWEPGQRLAASRAFVRAELRAPLSAGRILEVEPWVAGNAAGYLFDQDAQPALLDAWATGGAVLSTRLERAFGSGADALRHVIEPRVEWRVGSAVAGPQLPAYAYDEVDAAPVLPGAPCLSPSSLKLSSVSGGCLPIRALSSTLPGGFDQMRIALRNRLVGPLASPAGTLSATRIELDLGQDVDLQAGKLGETWVRGGASWGPMNGSLLARFFAFGAAPAAGAWTPVSPNWLDHFTELRLDLSAIDARGDRAALGFLALGSSASAAMRAGLDPLFDPRPIPFQAFGQVTGSLKVHVFGGLDAQWDTWFSVRSIETYPGGAGNPNYNSGLPVPSPPGFQQNIVTVSWTSPCECWRALIRVQVSQGGFYSVSGGLDLSQLAGFHLSQ